jgi:hypothetical protein
MGMLLVVHRAGQLNWSMRPGHLWKSLRISSSKYQPRTLVAFLFSTLVENDTTSKLTIIVGTSMEGTKSADKVSRVLYLMWMPLWGPSRPARCLAKHWGKGEMVPIMSLKGIPCLWAFNNLWSFKSLKPRCLSGISGIQNVEEPYWVHGVQDCLPKEILNFWGFLPTTLLKEIQAYKLVSQVLVYCFVLVPLACFFCLCPLCGYG